MVSILLITFFLGVLTILHRQNTLMCMSIPLEKRIGVALWHLALGIDFKTLSEMFGMGNSTVCVWMVCCALLKTHIQFISLPKGNRLREIVDGFQDKWGFPHCGGALGGSHISITAPCSSAKDYANDRGRHSIILQPVADHLSRGVNTGKYK